jgi:CysZ protein
MKFSKYLVVALLSPLLSFLSQKTEKIITGNSYRFDMKQLWKDIKRGLKLLIRNLVWWYLLIVLVYLMTFAVSGKFVTFPTTVVVFIISSFYYGFSFLDYVNERRRLNIDESILFVRKHRGLALLIGAGYSVLILVPVDLSALFDWNRISVAPIDMLSQFFVHLFLWFCASVAPIIASVASALAMHELVDLSANEWVKNANV